MPPRQRQRRPVACIDNTDYTPMKTTNRCAGSCGIITKITFCLIFGTLPHAGCQTPPHPHRFEDTEEAIAHVPFCIPNALRKSELFLKHWKVQQDAEARASCDAWRALTSASARECFVRKQTTSVSAARESDGGPSPSLFQLTGDTACDAAMKNARVGTCFAFDTTLAYALYLHYIEQDFERAVEHYAWALWLYERTSWSESRDIINLGDYYVAPVDRAAWWVSTVRQKNAIPASERLHELACGALMHGVPTDDKKQAHNEMLTKSSVVPDRLFWSFRITTGEAPIAGTCARSLLERALLADHWLKRRDVALALYRQSLKCMRISEGFKANQQQQYVVGRVSEILRGDDKVTADDMHAMDKTTEYVFAGRDDPGYGITYLPFILNGLYQEYECHNPAEAKQLYENATYWADSFRDAPQTWDEWLLKQAIGRVGAKVEQGGTDHTPD